ncbi:MAG: hypothetical protein LBP24_04185 [Coriobacteriales bacterium]|jgi:hypothetical protein|nr:hypothetical protein [Coriobacteriales bacterium]
MGRHDEEIESLRHNARSLDEALEDFVVEQHAFLAGDLEDMRWYWNGDKEMSLQLEILSDDMRQDSRSAEHAYNERQEDIANSIKHLKQLDAKTYTGNTDGNGGKGNACGETGN